MRVKVLKEVGYEEALFALGLSYGLTSEITFDEFCDPDQPALFNKMAKVAKNLSSKDWGHNSFMEIMQVWFDVDAPRYWHSERDRYRMSTQFSESTIHTLRKRPLTQRDFENPIEPRSLAVINELIEAGEDVETLKDHLPEGFLQRRVIMMSYKTLRNVLIQREGHRLPQWEVFRVRVLEQLRHPELLGLDSV